MLFLQFGTKMLITSKNLLLATVLFGVPLAPSPLAPPKQVLLTLPTKPGVYYLQLTITPDGPPTIDPLSLPTLNLSDFTPNNPTPPNPNPPNPPPPDAWKKLNAFVREKFPTQEQDPQSAKVAQAISIIYSQVAALPHDVVNTPEKLKQATDTLFTATFSRLKNYTLYETWKKEMDWYLGVLKLTNMEEWRKAWSIIAFALSESPSLLDFP
jgi:hypothetical protein